MKVLVVGDLHGRFECLENAYKTFIEDSYDLLVLLGDYTDSFDKLDVEIVHCVNLAISIKKMHPDNVILLLGNHDLQYMYYPDFRCSGFRSNLQYQLTHLFHENSTLFQSAFQFNNYLFTHAGVNQRWYNKYKERFDEYRKLWEIEPNNYQDLFNCIDQTHDRWILHEVGTKRGGMRYDCGGITWSDKDEIMQYNPLKGFHQIVGHTPQKEIVRKTKFQGNVHQDTSVTFCDVLGTSETFLTLNI